jgi:hypothetical protein
MGGPETREIPLALPGAQQQLSHGVGARIAAGDHDREPAEVVLPTHPMEVVLIGGEPVHEVNDRALAVRYERDLDGA